MRRARPALPEALAPLALPLLLLAACAPPGAVSPADVDFDTAVVWVVDRGDSTRISVEVAATQAQHEVGLAGRAALAPDQGMLFEFDATRSGDDGFWMWRTRFPLDIAFIDGTGVIRRILSMEPCTASSQDECPGYFPEVSYDSALEVSRGLFARHGIDAGAVVRVER